MNIAQPIYVISDADLVENGGDYKVIGRFAIPVHGLSGGGSAENAVLYVAQSLSGAQQLQARSNIGLNTVGQAEAEAGVATTTRAWTAERVKQAIEAFSGATAFTALTDTPTAYAAAGGKLVAVNVGADGLEFVDAPTSGGELFKTCTIYAAGSWDGEVVPLFQAPSAAAIEILQVNAAVIGASTPTLAFNLQIRPWGSLGSAGTNVFASAQTATGTGIELTTFAEDAMDAKDYLVFTTGSSAEGGIVSVIVITVYYREV